MRFIFPKNSVWFDFYTDDEIRRRTTKSFETKENYIPTYVRAGAFIPLAKLVQTTDDYSFSDFDLHYYFDEDIEESERKFYNDDGMTKHAFEKGKYEILEFEAENEKWGIEIDFEAEMGENYNSETKTIDLIIHNIDKAPKRIKLDHKKIQFEYDSLKQNTDYSRKMEYFRRN